MLRGEDPQTVSDGAKAQDFDGLTHSSAKEQSTEVRRKKSIGVRFPNERLRTRRKSQTPHGIERRVSFRQETTVDRAAKVTRRPPGRTQTQVLGGFKKARPAGLEPATFGLEIRVWYISKGFAHAVARLYFLTTQIFMNHLLPSFSVLVCSS